MYLVEYIGTKLVNLVEYTGARLVNLVEYTSTKLVDLIEYSPYSEGIANPKLVYGSLIVII